MPKKLPVRRDPAWANWAVSGLLILLIALIYGQTLRFGFLTYDDAKLVNGNRFVKSGLTAEGFRAALVSGPMGEWYPLSMASHMLDCQIFGLKGWGHHLTNLVLHAATCVGLFFVMRSMTGQLWPSAMVAMLLAVHPQHVESVAWIAERRDVLSGVFFVLTLAAYLGYVRQGRTIARYLLLALAYSLGLMSKATLVTVPPLLLLLDYWPLGRYGRAEGTYGTAERQSFWWLVVEKLPLVALSVGDCVLTVLTHRADTISQHSLYERLTTAAVVLVKYLRQAFWPGDLAAFYSFPSGGYPAWIVAIALAVLLAVTVVAVVWRRSCPYLLVGWFWFVGMLFPLLGLLTISAHAMADRYMYLPQIGLSIAVCWGAMRLAGTSADARWALVGSSVLVVAILVACSLEQTAYWANDRVLWTRSVAVTGSNAKAERALADALARDNQPDEAIKHYRIANGFGFDHELVNNWGAVLAQRKRYAEAAKMFQMVVNYDPEAGPAHANLGWMLFEEGKDDEAAQHLRRAIELDPRVPQPHFYLAQVLDRAGQSAEAIEQYHQALQLAPNNPAILQALERLQHRSPSP